MRKRERSPSPADSGDLDSDYSGIEEISPPSSPPARRSKRPAKKRAKLASETLSFTTSLAAATSSALSGAGARGNSKTRRMLQGLLDSVNKGTVSKAEAEAVKGLKRNTQGLSQRRPSAKSSPATASQKGKARARQVSEPKVAVTTVGKIVMLPFGAQPASETSQNVLLGSEYEFKGGISAMKVPPRLIQNLRKSKLCYEDPKGINIPQSATYTQLYDILSEILPKPFDRFSRFTMSFHDDEPSPAPFLLCTKEGKSIYITSTAGQFPDGSDVAACFSTSSKGKALDRVLFLVSREVIPNDILMVWASKRPEGEARSRARDLLKSEDDDDDSEDGNKPEKMDDSNEDEDENQILPTLSQPARASRFAKGKAKEHMRLPSSSPPPSMVAGPSSNARPSENFQNSFSLLDSNTDDIDGVPTRPNTPDEDVVANLSSTFSSQLIVGSSANPWARKRSAGFSL
ncbi:hypothetical protein BKA70DRAFT_1222714 [Coprinopsis sp. MPI-PUGE-AT-0042]|nr:hypothetical protein BKA70DRAFT_1222714 [Coprinopsis sp. MPI-PUGE-AT-0042]